MHVTIFTSRIPETIERLSVLFYFRIPNVKNLLAGFFQHIFVPPGTQFLGIGDHRVPINVFKVRDLVMLRLGCQDWWRSVL